MMQVSNWKRAMQISNLYTSQFQMIEWEYISHDVYNDPFNEIELDVYITAPSKQTWLLPTFWKGGEKWQARFIPKEEGVYTLESRCSDKRNSSLHACKHYLHVEKSSSNPQCNYRYIHLDSTKRYFEEDSGKPFFWLADTWWMGLSDRLSFDTDFQKLLHDRKQKGFSVIQLVMGLFPDMDHFDPRCKNEAGLPWEDGYQCINPDYFDQADRRILSLCTQGFVACIVGAWGYYIHKMGEKKMRQHWRNIIARWGALPVVWCIAGEGAMPYYLSKSGPKDREIQIKKWTKIGFYIKEIDPFKRPITIHPTDSSITQLTDISILDFCMLQAGHNGYSSIDNGIQLLEQYTPLIPTMMSEINYEGIMHDTGSEVQRLGFWSTMLNGSIGFSYGANGIWQANTPKEAFGPSPHGGTWGNTPWNEAMGLYGSKELGLGKKLLEQYPWWQIKPHQEWIEPIEHPNRHKRPYAAGIPKQLRIIYFYEPIYPWSNPPYYLCHMESSIFYHAYFVDPRCGSAIPLGIVTADDTGRWKIPPSPTFDDWLLILEYAYTKEHIQTTSSVTLSIVRLIRKLFNPSS